MSFALPDLIVESVIRDGLANLKADPTIIDDLFAQLAYTYADRKYGAAEIAKIKTWITGSDAENISIMQAYNVADAKLPAIVIQLGSDIESEAFLDDFEEDLQEDITSGAALAAITKVAAFTPTSYDSTANIVYVADGVDLSVVYDNYIFVDASDTEHTITNAISDVDGDKFFIIEPNGAVDVAGDCTIKTFLEYTQLEIRGSHQNVQLLLTVTTKDALTTKFLYTILKYILKSRKKSLMQRGMAKITMSGSDFNRNQQYEGDVVYTRFLTLSGHILESWRSDQVDLTDNVVFDLTPVD